MLHPRVEVAPPHKRLRGIHFGAFLLSVLIALGNGCGGLSRNGVGQGNLAVRPFPGDTARLLQNASYFKLQGRPQMALQALEEAHQLAPRHLKVANDLAEYCEELGQTDRALQVYQEALALDDNNPGLNNNLCFSYYLAGNWSQAEACFRKTVDRQPENKAARNNLGLLLCRQGRQEEARRLWQAEGEVVADRMLDQALAALGVARTIPLARQPEPGKARMAIQADPKPLPLAALPPAPGPTEKIEPEMANSGPVPGKFIGSAARADARGIEPAATAAMQPAPATQPALGRGAEPAPGALAAGKLEKPLAPVLHPAPKAERGPTAAVAAEAEPVPNEPGPQEPKPTPVIAPEARAAAIAAATGAATKQATSGPITASELLETNIALRNGNGIPDLARNTRSLLHLEGFDSVSIGNHIDFGMERTVVFYRPEAEKVARLLGNKFFPEAELKPEPQLTEELDVKIILGRDLAPEKQRFMAQGRGSQKAF